VFLSRLRSLIIKSNSAVCAVCTVLVAIISLFLFFISHLPVGYIMLLLAFAVPGLVSC